MGQKINPHGLRVGVIKDWDCDAKWVVDSNDKIFERKDEKVSKILTLKKANSKYINILKSIKQYIISALERLSKRNWIQHKILL